MGDHLTHLYLSQNRISTFPAELCTLGRLTTLDLSQNLLTAVPEKVGSMGGLAHLDLGYNQIAALPDSIAGISGMQILYLDDNQLPYIPRSLIAMLPQLENFKIEPNAGFDIPEDARKGGIKTVVAYLQKIARS